jgi:hypothetical protein
MSGNAGVEVMDRAKTRGTVCKFWTLANSRQHNGTSWWKNDAGWWSIDKMLDSPTDVRRRWPR